MALFQLLIILVILGVVAWIVQRYIPLAEPFKTLIVVLIALVAIFFLLDWAGLLDMSLRHAALMRAPAHIGAKELLTTG